MFQKLRKLSFFLLPFGVIPAILLLLGVLISFYESQNSYVYESSNPTNLGSAVFYQDSGGMDGTSIKLLVRDFGLENGALFQVDSVEITDLGIFLKEAFWSRDGSLIIVRSETQGTKTKTTYCYDFRQHKKVGQWLLSERGGAGENILDLNEAGALFFRRADHPQFWEIGKYTNVKTVPAF